MPRAVVLIHPRKPYNGDVFAAALENMGYETRINELLKPINHRDILVLWNRCTNHDELAKKYEEVGARVIVVENGYLGRNLNGQQWYAMALGQHNGAGTWGGQLYHGYRRWQRMNVPMMPWREQGEHIVVLASRGIGSPECREPPDWSIKVMDELRANTNRKVRLRRHPGPQNAVPKVSLEEDLKGAHAVVTWGSTAGLKALLLGVPVFYGFPKWIGRFAARQYGTDIELPYMHHRSSMFEQVAWAMWTLDEIKEGIPFKWLLSLTK